MMLMSQGAISASVIGLPRPGPSAAQAVELAVQARATAMRATLCVNMADLPLVIHRPAGDRIEVLARKGEHGRRRRGLSAQLHEIGARRLRCARLVPRPGLEHCGLPIPAPW